MACIGDWTPPFALAPAAYPRELLIPEKKGVSLLVIV